MNLPPAKRKPPVIAQHKDGALSLKNNPWNAASNPFMQRYENNLKHLHELLRKCVKPKTAEELSILLKCTKPTVYSRIQALESRGVRILRTKIPQPSGCTHWPVGFSLEKSDS